LIDFYQFFGQIFFSNQIRSPLFQFSKEHITKDTQYQNYIKVNYVIGSELQEKKSSRKNQRKRYQRFQSTVAATQHTDRVLHIKRNDKM